MSDSDFPLWEDTNKLNFIKIVSIVKEWFKICVMLIINDWFMILTSWSTAPNFKSNLI